MTTIAELSQQIDALRQKIETLKADPPKDRKTQFVKFDLEKRLVYAEVYLPDTPDAHGHEMTRAEIEKMAHNFLANARTMMIDLNHDNKVSYGCAMVESFIARDGDPDYVAGAWVGVVFVGSDTIWKAILDGEITGFSFEGRGYVEEVDEALASLA